MQHLRVCFLGVLCALYTFVSAANAQTQLLQNSNFESWNGNSANNWWVNHWGGAAFSEARVTGRSGSGSAMKLTVSSLPIGSGLLYRQDYRFRKGRFYSGSVWLKSSGSLKVQAMLRESGPPYAAYATKTLNVGSANWTQVVIKGGFDGDRDGCLGLHIKGTGTLYIDDASMTEYSAQSWVATTDTIPSTHFGVHSNRFGNVGFTSWKAHQTDNGTLRMWDTDTFWAALEPQNNVWVWRKLDDYVNAARGADSNIKIILVLGMTPKWAVANSANHRESPYYTIPAYIPEVPLAVRGQRVLTNAPDSLTEWKDYVKAVANRYAGRIQYFEIWNEANEWTLYSGSVSRLKDLEAATKAALNEVGSSIKVISPSWTDYGLSYADDYFFLGGGKNADILAWHWYFGFSPEDRLPIVEGARQLANSYGMSGWHIWNTEGASIGAYAPGDSEARAAVSRAYITQWSVGVRNWNFHGYDINRDTQANLSVNNNQDLTAAGIAMRETGNWLKGAQMTGKWSDSIGFWTLEIQRPGGYIGRIIWHQQGHSFNWTIPAGWGTVRARRLDGSSFNTYDGWQIWISGEPILLENQ